MKSIHCDRLTILICVLIFPVDLLMAAVPFEFIGPGVNLADFRITTFATELNYPVGMAQLADGSMLVAVTNGNRYFPSTEGSIIRLVDHDRDGVADEKTTLFDAVPVGRLTSLEIAGDLVLATGQGSPIAIFRRGQTSSSPLILLGTVDIQYPQPQPPQPGVFDWVHPHTALAIRKANLATDSYEVYFQVGSKTNADPTLDTVSLTSSLGLNATLNGDAIYRMVITNDGVSVAASDLQQIATGLRNASGLGFHPVSGDLYIADNNIDGKLANTDESISTDELNVIAAADLGGSIEDFGFPFNYTELRTGKVIGGNGIQPLVALLPIPEPSTGVTSEGPNQIEFSPKEFPASLQNGVFIGMHGDFLGGGKNNTHNAVFFVDLDDQSYFHVIPSAQEGIGHLDGLMATSDSLFLADIAPLGGFAVSTGLGKIYQVQRVSIDPPVLGDFDDDGSIGVADINLLTAHIRDGGTDVRFDLNGDGKVDQVDRTEWVATIRVTWFGDANLDSEFNSADFISVFQGNLFEIDRPANWEQGDWNGDGRFDSGDFIVAFQEGGYEMGPRSAAVVPEPVQIWIMMIFGLLLAQTMPLETSESESCLVAAFVN